jgi:hypothetical protein
MREISMSKYGEKHTFHINDKVSSVIVPAIKNWLKTYKRSVSHLLNLPRPEFDRSVESILDDIKASMNGAIRPGKAELARNSTWLLGIYVGLTSALTVDC